MKLKINYANASLKGSVLLSTSKSIANRALIIRALCQEKFEIKNLSNAKDTQTLSYLLSSKEEVFDAGHAGTTFRFMTAYLALQEGSQILTGSDRMKQRPIGVLVDALRELGAQISYLEKEGYPPLKIDKPNWNNIKEINVPADISSQYISALLMIAPCLPNGLKIVFEGQPVSFPYIQMTLNMMAYFGIEVKREGFEFSIAPQYYQAKNITVEADWSAASYYYAMAAISQEAEIELKGLFQNSWQGDAVIRDIAQQFFGIDTIYNEDGIILTKQKNKDFSLFFEYDFTECPDIAQTCAVICAALNMPANMTGLKTLRIKETDRIQALKDELVKVSVEVSPYKIKDDEGIKMKGTLEMNEPTFATYEDHRMAMAFAPLSLLGTIYIEKPNVVQKSYPDFWKDFEKIIDKV